MSKVRIIPLGGVSHVTRNMFVYEYLADNGQAQRLIVDCGIGFPEEEMLGVDVVLPDISYLKGKEKTILGIVLTHGHDDHIAGIPYLLPELGPLPIYASSLTAGFLESTLADFGLKAQINVVKDSEIVRIGSFGFEFVHVTHSVPDSKHIVLYTPIGIFYHGSDFKLDFSPVDHKKPDIQKMALVGSKKVLCMLSDCLRVEKSGFTASEKMLEETFEREIKNCQGKFIVTMISSNIFRIQQAVKVAANHGRKVAFLGRSIEENIAVAQRLGFFKIHPDAYLKKQKINKIPDNKLCLIVAGSQGQEASTLVRMADETHNRVSINPEDKVVFSTDPIPGNENAFYQTIDKISRLGASVSYSDIMDDLHVSGHASAGELKIVLSLVKPKFVVPIGGSFRHMNHYRNMAQDLDFTKEQVPVLDDGQIISFDQNGSLRYEEKIELKTIIVDGTGIGDVGRIVLSDRKKMSREGVVMAIIPVDKKTGKVISLPNIVSRGFVYMRTSKDLIAEGSEKISRLVPLGSEVKNWQNLKEKIENDLSAFFYQEIGREPMILPVLVKV